MAVHDCLANARSNKLPSLQKITNIDLFMKRRKSGMRGVIL